MIWQTAAFSSPTIIYWRLVRLFSTFFWALAILIKLAEILFSSFVLSGNFYDELIDNFYCSHIRLFNGDIYSFSRAVAAFPNDFSCSNSIFPIHFHLPENCPKTRFSFF